MRPGGLELPTFWFVVKFSFAISLICLGSAYLLHPGFRWFSGLIGPILDPTCGACRFFPLAAALCFQQVPVQEPCGALPRRKFCKSMIS